MLQECKCGKQFTTEADPYVIIPAENYTVNCGCFLTTKLQAQITRLEREIEFKDNLIALTRQTIFSVHDGNKERLDYVKRNLDLYIDNYHENKLRAEHSEKGGE